MVVLDEYIRQTVGEIFSTMVFMEIEPGKTLHGRPDSLDCDISSMIGLAGDLKGVLTIRCPAEVAMQTASSMLGMSLTGLDEDVRDALGEIGNMVAGGLKSSLSAEGMMINIAVPTTIIGRGVRTSSLPGAEHFTVPFSLAPGILYVELQYVAS